MDEKDINKSERPQIITSTPNASKIRNKKLTIGIVIFVVLSLSSMLFLSNFKLTSPNFTGKEIAAKRSATRDELVTEFTVIGKSNNLKEYAQFSLDKCYKGQHNWKINHDYMYRCEYTIYKYYGFNDDFDKKMLDLHQKLLEEWDVSGIDNGLDYIIGEHNKCYLNTPTDDELRGKSGVCSSAYVDNSNKCHIDYFVNPDVETCKKAIRSINQSVSNLSSAGYIKNNVFFMRIDYTDDLTNTDYEYWQPSSSDDVVYEDISSINVRKVLKNIRNSHKYVLIISMEKEYYKN